MSVKRKTSSTIFKQEQVPKTQETQFKNMDVDNHVGYNLCSCDKRGKARKMVERHGGSSRRQEEMMKNLGAFP